MRTTGAIRGPTLSSLFTGAPQINKRWQLSWILEPDVLPHTVTHWSFIAASVPLIVIEANYYGQEVPFDSVHWASAPMRNWFFFSFQYQRTYWALILQGETLQTSSSKFHLQTRVIKPVLRENTNWESAFPPRKDAAVASSSTAAR